jgi:hypothetical protein
MGGVFDSALLVFATIFRWHNFFAMHVKLATLFYSVAGKTL